MVRLSRFAVSVLLLTLVVVCAESSASSLRDTLLARRQVAGNTGTPVLPAGTRVIRDVAYGNDPRQRFDVYAPAQAAHAPVIFMVHGGGWRRGDKAMDNVVANKVARWLPRGFIVISTNYRMRPDTAPLQQAEDVARALAMAQRQAAQWGGDAQRFILMGHSAGAHLVALLSAAPALAKAQGAQPWLGAISLDGGSLDVVQTMQAPHFPLFDEAFGANPADWRAASPFQQLQGRIVPFLAVCSSQRLNSCAQSHAFVGKARSFGSQASVLEEDLSHGEINQQLGLPADYTRAVERFMRSLDPAVSRLLDDQAARIAALPVVIDR
ncbi:alpha/beta hydrolase [Rhodanobacter sp. AS-Z3]|uniref:alpha/beta hydrolase n=1 Tax=Rhodanobacter sp. AS-Z3 TaxID=3031330 RepID=UPI002479FA58|nr:alpha/beta hydrolase [Rhodanobacter sp. AS-Z3]WEN14159.1 alpha/beta hydrolase [Rhodanobacter sp. AS-Z3]